MRFDKFIPSDQLKPYIKYFIISESESAVEYKVFPSVNLVMGFQYKGQLAAVLDKTPFTLSAAGITGIADRYKVFKNTVGTASILVYFTEIGFAHFFPQPANELFNLSLSLEDLFNKDVLAKTKEMLLQAQTDQQRIQVIESFLISQLKDVQQDKLVTAAVNIIHASKGAIRIKDLGRQLFISQSPLEKRFRKLVGTTPKKFASIVRFNAVLQNLKSASSLTIVSYESDYFDQAHFIKDFKQFTGDTPESFRRSL